MRERRCKLNGAQGAAILLLSTALLTSCDDPAKSKKAAAGAPLPAVVVTPAAARPVSTLFEFIGQTEAFQQVELRARVTGFLLESKFLEGGPVKQGDMLFVIDPAQFNATRDAAAAKVKRAEATITEAEAQLGRYSVLTERGTTSEAKLDEAKATAGQARADLAAAKADLEGAELNVAYTKIAAPLSGRIGRGKVDVGNLVGPDTGVLATIVALDPIRVTFSVSEREYLNYRQRQQEGKAQSFTPKLKLANGQTYGPGGKIDFVDVKVDATTGTVPLRATFPNPDGTLLPGQFVNVTLVGSDASERIIVPQAAIQQDQSGYFVLLVDGDGKVAQRTVKTGQRVGGSTVVEDGLTVGESVIVEGIQKVRPGARVTTVQAPVPAAN